MRRMLSLGGLVSLLSLCAVATATAQHPVIPGTGQVLAEVGDDFEAEDWAYSFALPKSSQNLDSDGGGAGGEAENGRWYEGHKRGQPDVIRTVPTPAGGLPGSRRSLLIRSRDTGVPGRPSGRMQQDDFIASVHETLGYTIPVDRSPNVVVRVFLPKVNEWERRSGCHFAFRLAVETSVPRRGLLGFSSAKSETYWPGMFLDFQTKEDSGLQYDTARFRIRADGDGDDFEGPPIRQTGWWTLGISCTPDGAVHYYASPGVDPLTEEDHLTTQYPYGFRVERFRTFFFNVCSGDDGRTWSTAWTLDDPQLRLID